MSRRGRKSSPFSLFAFQDIITSVTGIMILVTLILGLELLHRKDSPPRRTSHISIELQSAVAQSEHLRALLRKSQVEIEGVAGFDVGNVRQQLRELTKVTVQLTDELSQSESERSEALRLLQEAEQVKAARASDPQNIQQLLGAAKGKIESLRKLKARNQVIYNRPAGESKTPWLVEISGQSLLVAQIGKRARPQMFAQIDAFKNWVRKRNKSAEYFVLIVKPSGAESFHDVQQHLRRLKFEIGFDLLTENETAISPETGAVAE